MESKEDVLLDIAWKGFIDVTNANRSMRSICGSLITANGILLLLFANSSFLSPIGLKGQYWIILMISVILCVCSIILCILAINISRGIHFNLNEYYPVIATIPDNELKSFIAERIVFISGLNTDLYKKCNNLFRYALFTLIASLAVFSGYLLASEALRYL